MQVAFSSFTFIFLPFLTLPLSTKAVPYIPFVPYSSDKKHPYYHRLHKI